MQKRIVLKGTNSITLTNDQSNSLEVLSEWYKSKELCICLNGSAGTGKTTLAKYFINTCVKGFTEICVAAPTHQAKEVISKKTELIGYTIHKLLGIRLDLDLADFDPENPVYDMKGKGIIEDFDIIIIDEASMINSKLYELLLKKANSFGIKILFLGDELQLNPVGEKISPVFVQNKTTTLTEIVRQTGDSPLLDLFTVIRKDIINGTEDYLNLLDKSRVTKSGGYKVYHRQLKSDSTNFLNEVCTHFKNPINNNKILTWTSKNGVEWNAFTKNKVNPTEEEVYIGDTIVGNVNLYDSGSNLIFMNSNSYRITNCIHINKKVEGVMLAILEITCIDLSSNNTCIYHVIRRESYGKYASILLDKLDKARKARNARVWAKYYNFKSQFLVGIKLETITGRFIEDKSFTLGYSTTIHKSQGSTYDNTFIIHNNIMKNWDVEERTRLVYVALSRTSNISHIFKN